MSTLNRLRKREAEGRFILAAIVGAGFMGRGIVRQINQTPGMRAALVVSRRPEAGVEALALAGCRRSDIVVSDNMRELQRAIDLERPAVTTELDALRDLRGIECVVESTGAVEHGARAALRAIEGGKHIVMMNAETDATVGCALRRLADEAGVVYTDADGDQPGVLMRMIEWVRAAGFEVVAAINCKGFMDPYATPQSIRPWAEKQGTSLLQTTSMTDGTKMNIENAVIANATGLLPEVRGMHGVKTDLAHALADCLKTFGRGVGASRQGASRPPHHQGIKRNAGVVDFTLGGDFGGGVFVIGHADNPQMVQPYMKYLKMGDGPNYLFFRPFHLCHFETPMSVADAVLDHEATIAPMAGLDGPLTEVLAIAKRDLRAGEILDGIGGETLYGRIDTAARSRGLLPIGLADGVRLTRSIRRDEPLPTEAVQLDEDSLLMSLRSAGHPAGLQRVA